VPEELFVSSYGGIHLDKKELIRQSAIDVIAEKGYFNTTAKIIAEKAGIAVGTIYIYFSNKEEILSLQMILAIGIIIGGIYLVISSPVGTTNDQSLSKSGFILGFLAAFFFAATNVSRKAGINFIPSAIVGSAFSSLAALLAFTIYYWTKKSLKEILYVEKESLIKFCLGGVLASGALFSYFMALKFVSVSVAMAVANIEPLFTILLAHFSGINDEPITFKFISGAIIVVIGVALLILS